MASNIFNTPLTNPTTDEALQLRFYSHFEENGGTVYYCKSGCDRRVYLAKSSDGSWLVTNENDDTAESFADLHSAFECVDETIDEFNTWDSMGLLPWVNKL